MVTTTPWHSLSLRRGSRLLLAATLTTAVSVGSLLPGASAATDSFLFTMRPAQTCLPNARGQVTIHSLGPVENMHVEVSGLPAHTEFDFFVIQVPQKPFGLAWYQGDITTDGHGHGVGDFTGRFNQETFIVAQGVDVAPVLHHGPNPDADENPQTGPIHTFHLGLWFNSPADATKAGCPGDVTPFNGEHNAGVQVLNTSQFGKENGPLRRVEP